MNAGISIPEKPRQEIIHRNWGDTQDIISVIMDVVNKTELGKQVEQFSAAYKAKDPRQQREKLHQLWKWVRREIPYIADPDGMQIIKHPARTYEDAMQGRGSDCKSMTVFVRFVLYNLGIPHYIRFASYVRSNRVQHVYTVAIVGGKDVIIDTVHTRFDDEVAYTHIQDIKPDRMTKIIEIAGVPGRQKVQTPERPWFPVSRMTEGELQLAGKIRELEILEAHNRTLGRTQAADQQAEVLNELNTVLTSGLHSGGLSIANLPKLKKYWRTLARMDKPCYLSHINIGGEYDPTDEQEAYCRQQARNKANMQATTHGAPPWSGSGQVPYYEFNDGRRYGDVYYDFMDNCLELQEMENLVNDSLIDAGPNFLYQQMGTGNYNNRITQKQLNQEDWVYRASQATGLSEGAITVLSRTGTVEKLTGKGYGDLSTPEAAKNTLYPYMQPSSIGQADVGIALSVIIGLIGAITTLVSTGVAVVRSFQQNKRIRDAMEGIPDPGSPNTKITKDDFPVPTDKDGNEIDDGDNQDTGGGGMNTAAIFNDPTNLALVGAAAYLIFSSSNNSK